MKRRDARPTFKKWVRETFEGKDEPAGDFVADMKLDREFPRRNDREAILRHLYNRSACTKCIRTFKVLWYEYCLTFFDDVIEDEETSYWEKAYWDRYMRQ